MTQILEANRLRWACRRGMLELDILFETFLENGYPLLTEQERRDFDQLLEYPDQELYDFFMKNNNNNKIKEESIASLVEKIRSTAYNTAKKERAEQACAD